MRMYKYNVSRDKAPEGSLPGGSPVPPGAHAAQRQGSPLAGTCCSPYLQESTHKFTKLFVVKVKVT